MRFRPVIIFFALFLTYSLSSVPLKGKSYLTNTQLFISKGTAIGEGYFNPEGSEMVFQANGKKGNPFYQIYWRDMNTGQTEQISKGWGKNTCAWIHPHEKKILFASTQEEGRARSLEKQKNYKPQAKYSWSYDSAYDLIEYHRETKRYRKLTHSLGYDAEGAYSPDGKWIVFSSNAWAYKAHPKSKVDQNPSFYLELFIMRSDGKGRPKRLTHHEGYDGGPFFSPDGTRIVWRQFSKNGRKAEVFTMKKDGSDVKQITSLKTLSWAPFYHPSGEYLIFSTAFHGYKNFELYVVDVEGQKPPLRITDNKSSDVLPVFHPNGKELYWVKKSQGKSSIYRGDWDHNGIREALGIKSFPTVQMAQLKKWVRYLSSSELKGRDTGSDEEKIYSKKLYEAFRSYGLKPSVSYFKFLESRKVLPESLLKVGGVKLELKKDWMPVSQIDKSLRASTAFASYGLDIPATEKTRAVNSYKKVDVKDRWVMVLEGLPPRLKSEERRVYYPYSHLEHKILVARKNGAKGLLVLAEGDLSSKQALSLDTFPVAFVSKKYLKSLKSKNVEGFFRFKDKEKKARNTFGTLKVKGAQHTVVVGAHGDHLGEGPHPSSFTGGLHYGADDNASGVAALMELARIFSQNKKSLKQNVVFAVWSGEEKGLLGSQSFPKKGVSAYINMDMVGRLKDTLYVQGLASSSDWNTLIKHVKTDLLLDYGKEVYLPTDATSFYLEKIPTISFFTGAHSDYHTNRDVFEKINFQGLHDITHLVGQVVWQVASRSKPIKFQDHSSKNPHNLSMRARGFKVTMGTLPDYSYKNKDGLKLAGVRKGTPAEKAGLKKGDIISFLNGMDIKNIYDYVYSLSQMKPGAKTSIRWIRNGRLMKGTIVPEARSARH